MNAIHLFSGSIVPPEETNRKMATWCGRIAWATTFALAILATIQFPNAQGASLDDSWQLVLSQGFQHRLIFGRDLIFTYGPLGFLENHIQLRELFGLQLGWQACSRLASVTLIGVWMRDTPRWMQVLNFTAMWVLTTSPLSLNLPLNDAFFMLIIWVAGALLIVDGPKPFGTIMLCVALLASFALIKSSLAVAGTAVVATAGFFHCWQRRFGLSVALVLGFVACWLVGWCLAGQPLTALPDYFHGALEVVAGYPDAMMAPAPPARNLMTSGIVAVLFFVLICFRTWRHRTDSLVITIGLMTGGLLLLAWRHGSCRTDIYHLSGLFVWLGLVSLLYVAVAPANSLKSKAGRMTVLHLGFSVLAMFAFIACFDAAQFVRAKPGGLLKNVKTVARLALRGDRTIPEKRELPSTWAAVGNSELDVHGNYQAQAILGGYRYVGRPIPQSYSAYTLRLARINADWLAMKKPPFTLMKIESIDDRLPALEDALALRWTLQNYQVSLEEGGFILLALRPASRLSFPNTPAPAVEIPLTAWWPVNIPPGNQICYATIEAAFSPAGKIARSFIPLRPLRLEVKFTTGKTETYNLPLRMGQTGFVIYPFIRANADVVQWLTEGTSNRVSALRVTAPMGNWAYRETFVATLSTPGASP